MICRWHFVLAWNPWPDPDLVYHVGQTLACLIAQRTEVKATIASEHVRHRVSFKSHAALQGQLKTSGS